MDAAGEETGTAQMSAPASYAEATAELDALLGALDRDDVDVDRLAEQVERAAFLIAYCRERIVAAQARVERVVALLEEAAD